MNFKKYFSTVLALLLCFSMMAPAFGASASPSAWAVAEINRARTYGLVGDALLQDYQSPITREEFCDLVVRLYEVLTETEAGTVGSNPFKDTSNPAVLKANHLGIVGGRGEGLFAPKDPVTRQEIAIMIKKALMAANVPSGEYDREKVFVDQAAIAPWALDAIRELNYLGIMGGMGDNSINPLGNTTREQGIALIVRAYETFKGNGQAQQIPGVPPEAPKNVTLKAIGFSNIMIQWDEVPGADYYYVYESDQPYGHYELFKNEDGSPRAWYYDAEDDYQVWVYDCEPDTTHYYKITAVRNGIESKDSHIVSIKTPSLKGASYTEYGYHLEDTASRFYVENEVGYMDFSRIEVKKAEEDAKGIQLNYILDSEGGVQLLQALLLGEETKIKDIFMEVVKELQQNYGKDVYGYIIIEKVEGQKPTEIGDNNLTGTGKDIVFYDAAERVWRYQMPILKISHKGTNYQVQWVE